MLLNFEEYLREYKSLLYVDFIPVQINKNCYSLFGRKHRFNCNHLNSYHDVCSARENEQFLFANIRFQCNRSVTVWNNPENSE